MPNAYIIKSMPHVGECRVIRTVYFPSGRKFMLIDKHGRTWHKTLDEVEMIVDKTAE